MFYFYTFRHVRYAIIFSIEHAKTRVSHSNSRFNYYIIFHWTFCFSHKSHRIYIIIMILNKKLPEKIDLL